jgi:hypothetical protein
MMRAFIVRPFGVKKDVDFDAVERELIGPALDQVGITGRTTGEIVSQGNIREDMFRLLLTADLVIADLSIHNANVFYELGLRHSLRDKHTVLVRAAVDDVPFDLLTDRYLPYDPKNPAASGEKLSAAIRASLASESPTARCSVSSLACILRPRPCSSRCRGDSRRRWRSPAPQITRAIWHYWRPRRKDSSGKWRGCGW